MGVLAVEQRGLKTASRIFSDSFDRVIERIGRWLGGYGYSGRFSMIGRKSQRNIAVAKSHFRSSGIRDNTFSVESL